MMVRCDEPCHMKKWLEMPPTYCMPQQAVTFWLKVCGHIPEIYTYRCACGATMVSGPAIARELNWDEFTFAQNDILWILEHVKNHEQIWMPN